MSARRIENMSDIFIVTYSLANNFAKHASEGSGDEI